MSRPTTKDQGGVSIAAMLNKRLGPKLEAFDALSKKIGTGLEGGVELNRIVVVGDQSTGKSSLLEAISSVPMPIGNHAMTRSPIELQLRSTIDESDPGYVCFKYQLIPGSLGGYEEVPLPLDRLDTKTVTQEYRNILQIMAKARRLPSQNPPIAVGDLASHGIQSISSSSANPQNRPGMSLAEEMSLEGTVFEDPVILYARLPGNPNLTLIDLPGLVKAPEDLAAKVHKIVEDYVRDKNNAILMLFKTRDNKETVTAVSEFTDLCKGRLILVVNFFEGHAPASIIRDFKKWELTYNCQTVGVRLRDKESNKDVAKPIQELEGKAVQRTIEKDLQNFPNADDSRVLGEDDIVRFKDSFGIQTLTEKLMELQNKFLEDSGLFDRIAAQAQKHIAGNDSKIRELDSLLPKDFDEKQAEEDFARQLRRMVKEYESLTEHTKGLIHYTDQKHMWIMNLVRAAEKRFGAELFKIRNEYWERPGLIEEMKARISGVMGMDNMFDQVSAAYHTINAVTPTFKDPAITLVEVEVRIVMQALHTLSSKYFGAIPKLNTEVNRLIAEFCHLKKEEALKDVNSQIDRQRFITILTQDYMQRCIEWGVGKQVVTASLEKTHHLEQVALMEPEVMTYDASQVHHDHADVLARATSSKSHAPGGVLNKLPWMRHAPVSNTKDNSSLISTLLKGGKAGEPQKAAPVHPHMEAGPRQANVKVFLSPFQEEKLGMSMHPSVVLDSAKMYMKNVTDAVADQIARGTRMFVVHSVAEELFEYIWPKIIRAQGEGRPTLMSMRDADLIAKIKDTYSKDTSQVMDLLVQFQRMYA